MLIELHGFADSSSQAYAAVIYAHLVADVGVTTKILTSKTRVAPTKPLTIPRLELLSCLLLSKLMKSVIKSIKCEIKINRTICWTDLSIVYYWITQKCKDRKPWIQNRVNRINELETQWKHIPGSINPADIATRQINLQNNFNQDVWFNGPTFLHQSESDWPIQDLNIPVPTDMESKKGVVQLATLSFDDTGDIGTLIDLEEFSSLNKLLGVTALVLRFVNNLESWLVRDSGTSVLKGDLMTEEIQNAEVMWLKSIQKRHCEGEKFEKVKLSLKLFVDDNGLFRSKTRLHESENLSFNSCNPIYLPNEGSFVKLVILKANNRVCHIGVESTLNQIRAKYWIVIGKQTVKKVLRNCFICRLCQDKSLLPPVSPNLPDYRVSYNFPFEVTRVAYAGPLFVRDVYQNDYMQKCYIILFTCTSTRFVHLELVVDYKWESLVLSLKRFISRRGTCKLFISDNFSTFKLKEVKSFLRNWDISWKFILQSSPWWGGFYEKLIGLTKMLLKKIVGKAKLRYDELVMVLHEAENVINSQPLTYLTDDNYQTFLTPYHLVYGRNINFKTEVTLTESTKSNRESVLHRMKDLKMILDHFKRDFIWNI